MSTTLNVWAVTGTKRFLRTQAAGSGTTVSMIQARNEWRALQILARSTAQLTNFDIATEALSDGHGHTIAASNIVVSRAEQIEVVQETWRNANDDDSSGTLGWCPDALIPDKHPVTGAQLAPGAEHQALPFDLPANQTHTFIVDICTPKTAVPGDYTATLTVSADGQDDVEISISLTVWSWGHSDTPAHKTLYGAPCRAMHRNRALLGWSAFATEQWENINTVCKATFSKYRLSTFEYAYDDAFFAPTKNGTWSCDADTLLLIQDHIDRYHPAVYRLQPPHHVIDPYDSDEVDAYLGAYETAIATINRPDVQWTIWPESGDVGEAHSVAGSQFANVWGPNIFSSSIDSGGHAGPVPIGGAENVIGSLQVWIVSASRIYDAAQQAAMTERFAAGEELWFYVVHSGNSTFGTRPYREQDRPPLNYRLFPWFAYHEGGTGTTMSGSGVNVWAILRAGGDYWTDPGISMTGTGTGTVTVTKGTTLVTGLGTSFLTQIDKYIGLSQDGDAYVHQVVNVIDDTHLTLVLPWLGEDEGGLSFKIYLHNSDDMIVYPCTAAQVGFDGVLTSIRMLAVRDGIQDFEYLHLARALGLGDAVDAEVNALITAVGGGSWEWNTDPDAYDAARLRLGLLIESAWLEGQPPAGLRRQEPTPYRTTSEEQRITGDVADYVGRTTDVLAYDGAVARGEILLDQTLAQPAEGGKICTGIQKLAQRFLLELLTERGTMTYLPTRGTDFMYEARIGRFRTRSDIYGGMARALVSLKRNLQAEESDADPDDERYKNAEILQVAYTPGEAKIWIRVFSQDNNAIGILPISVTL